MEYRIFTYCTTCNKRNHRFLLNPFLHEFAEDNPYKTIQLICLDCNSNLKQHVNIHKSELLGLLPLPLDFIGLFTPIKFEFEKIVLGFGMYKGMNITEIERSYLEFLLKENAKDFNSRQYEVGLSLYYLNAIENYLGKWYNPSENCWISL